MDVYAQKHQADMAGMGMQEKRFIMGTTEARRPLSQDIVERAIRVSERAAKVVAFAQERLAEVMTDQCPVEGRPDDMVSKPRPSYPPLLEGLDNYLNNTERSLASLEDMISRCEV